MTLTQLHKKAKKEGWAVPHFNFSTFTLLYAILDGATHQRAPVLAGTSEGERDFLGIKQCVNMVKSLREKYDVPIFLNADHTKSVERAKEAVDAGYDSIHIDLSRESYQKNLEGVKRIVDYAKSKNKNIEVEGELGYLATESSKVYKEKITIPEDSYTKVEQAVEFVEKTKVDRLAPAIGNLHGIAANKPVIRFDLIEKLTKSLPPTTTLVLHGGSGIADKDLKKIVTSGFNNIHISTELRFAYTQGLKDALSTNKDDIAPYNYMNSAMEKVQKIVIEKLQLYNTVNVV